MVGAPRLIKSVVLVGLMGAGKSSVGLRLARALGADFVDSDDEIVEAANMSIAEIFERFGEPHFRSGERLNRDMEGVLDELSDEDLEDIFAWLASRDD